MLKVELHAHTADDPIDRIPHTTHQLIDRAAELGYDAIAVTLHDRQLDLRPYDGHARERGVMLIPGIERTIGGKHVLMLNFRRGAEDVRTFDDLARLRQREPGLVIAPHPFFPHVACLHKLLEQHSGLFDAVEYNAMFTSSLNFNRAAIRWARRHGKPIVGNGDVHRLRQLGSCYSRIDAERDPEALCAAIRAGKVEVAASPLTWQRAAGVMSELFLDGLTRRFEPAKRRPEYSTR